MQKILFIFFICANLSCSFPNKNFTNKIYIIKENSESLKNLLSKEFPTSRLGFPVKYIRNAQLKNLLTNIKASEIGITYKSTLRFSDSLHHRLPFLESDLDSTITISWIRKRNDTEDIYYSLFYFFGKNPPEHQVLNLKTQKDLKINDSIWLQKAVYDIVIVH